MPTQEELQAESNKINPRPMNYLDILLSAIPGYYQGRTTSYDQQIARKQQLQDEISQLMKESQSRRQALVSKSNIPAETPVQDIESYIQTGQSKAPITMGENLVDVPIYEYDPTTSTLNEMGSFRAKPGTKPDIRIKGQSKEQQVKAGDLGIAYVDPINKVAVDENYKTIKGPISGYKVVQTKLPPMASKMTQDLPKLSKALNTIEQLEKLYYKGWTPVSVPKGNVLKAGIEKIRGGVGRGVAMAGANPALDTYLKDKDAFTSIISKGGFGESGVLTDRDIERAKKTLPNPGTSKEQAQLQFDELKNMLRGAIEKINNSQNLTTNENIKTKVNPNTGERIISYDGGITWEKE